ncbi:TIGR02285 family protein [Uliginosibacterium sp. TH139]|uniref:TIGR02285 family protein n=1 Tax=Uliginosibacterium sp. TH139 TaxID=2067453 RepID=UPI000C79F7A6|nr:TIGR02285 family protein [Uliginosibacterium sp. TH139]PLK50585.1 hypothetical protein C0V76_01835 [Uliginosibacterium sp. TH139]
MRRISYALFLSLVSLRLAAAESVSWCQFDLPPMYIASGPEAGSGIVDGHAAFLMSKMPEFEHKWQYSNIARAQADIKAGHPLICGGLQRNAERESYMLFAEPFYASTAPQLILPSSRRASLKPWLNAAGEVKLSQAVSASGLTLGISSGRSYGQAIDEQLGALRNHPAIISRPAADDVGEGLIRMMQLGRLDMAIAFGSELRIYRQHYPNPADPLVTLPIAGMPRLIPAYFVAPQTDWGRQMIARINALQRQYWNDPDFRRSAFLRQDAEGRKRTEAYLRELDPRRKR